MKGPQTYPDFLTSLYAESHYYPDKINSFHGLKFKSNYKNE